MSNDKDIFLGEIPDGKENNADRLSRLPKEPPPWRDFKDKANLTERGRTYRASPEERDIINAALYLRRPLLLTGPPGVGKSSLAYAVAQELDLGDVLVWPITSKSTLQQGLYSYDALARLQEAAWEKTRWELAGKPNTTDKPELPDIGRYLRLGPLGTAFCESQAGQPRVLLIDEIDKSDIDLPNDLLHLFEEGEFEIVELARMPQDENKRDKPVELFRHGGKTKEVPHQDKVKVPRDGMVRCDAFPLVIMTSNGEREFPPAFLRRCLRLTIQAPGPDKLHEIIEQHLGKNAPQSTEAKKLIADFLEIRGKEGNKTATDQLLNAIYLVMQGFDLKDKPELRKEILAVLGDE